MKEYKTFNDLYNDYKDIIDVEFTQRFTALIDELCKHLKEKEEDAASEISGWRPGFENDVYREKLRLYGLVHKEVVRKTQEVLSVPHNSFIDYKIRKAKNEIVDYTITPYLMKARGTDRYMDVMKDAGRIADYLESYLHNAYYDKHFFDYDEDETRRKMACERIDRELLRMEQKNYHKNDLVGTMLLADGKNPREYGL